MSDQSDNKPADETPPEGDAAKPEEPKAEEPKAEEPASEPDSAKPADESVDPPSDASSEPSEEPKPEEPKPEEPKAEAPKSAGEILAGADASKSTREGQKAEEPKAEEPKAEEPKAEEPAAGDTVGEKVEEPAPDPAAAAVAAAKEEAPPEPQRTLEPTPAPAAPVLVPVGTLVEFESEAALMAAAAQVRDAGWTHWDAHTPYPVHGLDKAMGIKPTILPWIVFIGGLTGCGLGLVLQFYTNGIELPFSLSRTLLDPLMPSGYPYITSGKPLFSVPANIPVTFELTILLSAFGAFFSTWGLSKLPQFWHPVFTSTRFRRATSDRFFISFETSDPLFQPERTRAFAQTLGGSHVEDLMGEEE